MIQVSNLSKSYGSQDILDDISFTVGAGERVGLVGRNGHGKTTLFRLITGEERPDSGVINIPRGYTIGHLSQHIRFSCDTVIGEAAASLPVNEDGRDDSYVAEKILTGLGFTREDFGMNPHALSGGFQIRLNLAKLLIQAPPMLLLDEPTNYLDILSIRWLTQFLKNWKTEFIIITHDRSFMDMVTTHTLGIHRRGIRKMDGSTEKFYQQIIAEDEMYEKTRINDERKRKEVEQFIARFRVQATRARAVQSRIKSLQRQERMGRLEEMKNLDFSFNAAPFSSKWPAIVEDLAFSYCRDSKPLINNLNFTVKKGDRIGVIGKNGKGKSTLLRLLAGELMPVNGKIITHFETKIGYFGQTNINRLSPNKTVEEEILDSHPGYSRLEARRICGAMMFGGESALKKISVLSGGEKTRTLLGKLLASPSNLLLLDEPTNHLDMESVDSLIEAIESFDGAVVIVTHSEMILDAVATRLIVFDGDGAAVFEGAYRDFLDRVGWQDEAVESNRITARKETATAPAKKEARRLRAELIAERGKVLGLLNKKIAATENRIVMLEQAMEEDNAEILKASALGKGDKVSDLYKAVHAAKTEIDELFNELEKLTAEHNAKSSEFEKRFTASSS